VSPLELVDDRFEGLATELRNGRPHAPEHVRVRVAQLTRREPRPSTWSFRPPARKLALALVAAALLASLIAAGVTGLDRSGGRRAAELHGRNPSTGGAASSPARRLSPNIPQPFSALGDKAAKSPAVPTYGAEISPTQARIQRYDATLRLRVKDVDALSSATKRAMTVTRALGGYVASVGYSTRAGRRGGATLVLRVPITNVQDALQELTALGTILRQQTGILDVTKRVAREERQLATLRSELSTIEAELASGPLGPERRAQLERQAAHDRLALATLRAKHKRLLRSARLARIIVTLTTPAKQAAGTPGRLGRTMHDAGTVLVRELEILLYALVVVGPLLLLGGVAVGLGRAQRRRSDRRLLERSV
jgi:Domain of unknown function (DUF4349)